MRVALIALAAWAAAGRAQDERTGNFSAARRQLAATRSETYPNSGKQITEITNGLRNNRYYDKNSCPAGHTIWVPETLDEAEWARDTFGTTYTNVVGVFKTTKSCQDCKDNMEMNSGWSDPRLAADPSNHGRYWKSVTRTKDENEGNCGSCSKGEVNSIKEHRQRRPCYMTARSPDANKRALTPPSPIGRSTDDALTRRFASSSPVQTFHLSPRMCNVS